MAEEKPKFELTEEHKAQLKPWADKWIKNSMSTAPMTAAEIAESRDRIKKLYQAASVEAPPDDRIIFVADPFIMRYAAGFAAWIWHEKGVKLGGLDTSFISGLSPKAKAVAESILAITRGATEETSPVSAEDSTSEKIHGGAPNLGKANPDKIFGFPSGGSVDKDDEGDLWFRFPVKEMETLAQRATAQPEAAQKCASLSYRMWNGGNQWSAWVAFLSFFRYVVKLPLDYSKWDHYERLAEISGPRILHAKFAIICDRPTTLLMDPANRPHNDKGPFCTWSSGTSLYNFHGVRVPHWMIDHPEKLTVARIESEKNVEVRRIAITLYGSNRFLKDSGAVKIHEDKMGVLYQKAFGTNENVLMVKVLNSTPEPDGEIKEYCLMVHPQLRPLRSDNTLGEPQALTAHNAVASTFGLRGEEYAPQVET